jgi:hypothetical protein
VSYYCNAYLFKNNKGLFSASQGGSSFLAFLFLKSDRNRQFFLWWCQPWSCTPQLIACLDKGKSGWPPISSQSQLTSCFKIVEHYHFVFYKLKVLANKQGKKTKTNWILQIGST